MKNKLQLDKLNLILYNIINRFFIKGEESVVNEMNGREIVNLINRMRKQGIPGDEILDTIVYIEMTDPKTELIVNGNEDITSKTSNNTDE